MLTLYYLLQKDGATPWIAALCLWHLYHGVTIVVLDIEHERIGEDEEGREEKKQKGKFEKEKEKRK